MKSGSKLIKMTLLGAVAAAILASFVTYGRSSGDPRFREVKVERGDITSSVFSTGTVQPENRVDVKAPIFGRAEQVLVQEGDKVKRGQILLWMSSWDRASLLDAARAKGADEYKRWEDFYRPTPLIAPVSGTIIQRNIEPGQSFANTDPIFVMADRLIVEAPVDETDIAQIDKGQRTSLVLDAYPKHPIPSHVHSVAYEARTTNNVTTYMVTVILEKPPEFVRTGMTANVNFDIASKKSVLLLPAEAIKTMKNETYVLVPPSKGSLPLKRVIQTGLSDGRTVEVTEGLNEGDEVLIPIPVKAKDDQKSSVFPSLGH